MIGNRGMNRAAQGGHKELVELFIEKNIENGLANDWNRGIRGAACGGHKELVEFFRQKIQQQNSFKHIIHS